LENGVALRVLAVLEALYGDIAAEEARLSADGNFHGDVDGVENEVGLWARALYSSGGEIGRGSEVRLVGPVGERPVHVFLLRAGHFVLPARDGGPAARNGILRGVRRFLAAAAARGGSSAGEADAPYGKDYAAAARCAPSFATAGPGAAQPPPFYAALKAWSAAKLDGLVADRAGMDQTEEAHDRTSLVRNGLYEGETPLYFAVVAGDTTMALWLLRRGRARRAAENAPAPQHPHPHSCPVSSHPVSRLPEARR
jgi:hypothetical protein